MKLTPQSSHYESRHRILKFDVSTQFQETDEYDYEQEDWFGRSVALVYIDNG